MAKPPIYGAASKFFISNRQTLLHPLAIITFFLLASSVNTKSANGCILYDEICEENEICMQDGLFGECASERDDVALIVSGPADYFLKKVLSKQLRQLSRNGYTLGDARAQCMLAYFKLVLMLQLKYNLNFCNVANPEKIWRMLQSIKVSLTNGVTDVRNVNFDKESMNNFMLQQQQQMDSISDDDDDDEDNDENSDKNRNSIPEANLFGIEPVTRNTVEGKTVDNDKSILRPNAAYMAEDDPSLIGSNEEEVRSVDFVGYHAPLLKKDIEHLGNQNTGLENIEHKIVKGMPAYQAVDGNRVYLKVADDLNEDKLKHLINYLDSSIAKPNQLIFDDFLLVGDQLSFRAGRSTLELPQNEKHLDSVGGIAEDVYKRRKDIQTVSGIRVDETGIGSGQESVPIENGRRDRFFVPIIIVSTFTLVLLAVVMAIHQMRERRKKMRELNNSQVESQKYAEKASLAYENLCRYQMASAHESTTITDNHINQSTSTTWIEEPIGQSNLDISTGHVILSFLHDYLDDTTRIEEQWDTLNEYTNPNGISTIAREEQNMSKNRNPLLLPYDDTLVSIGNDSTTFINASAIHDCDPKHANYIATQSPLPETVIHFWQMIWEQAAMIIVNLANDDDREAGECIKYWPDNGSQIHGSFEIHLVSEHIWSEDYLVRSFYLKNLKTNETRTVTQFHFLTWPRNEVPANTKALLDFRRKINKSYRGRAAPIVVHCTDGIGRTGTFCLLDMILNRVTRGVKELNVAGSLEHLRDQRPGMVESCEQYKMVFVCLAEEITAIIAALST